MENQSPQERTLPVQFSRGSRAFRQFKNPPQPHMCIQDTIKDTTEKLYINVLGWQKIANPKQFSDPIPLYGGMQVPQGCGPSTTRPPLLVFAVMVNPDILKQNGKNASATDREALVSLLCDFVEAMNPGLVLTRAPVILGDRDLAGELKDVWMAVQNKRQREKELNIDVMYKVYDIDGIGGEHGAHGEHGAPAESALAPKAPLKSSKQILMNAGQTSEFDSGMNNSQLTQNNVHPTHRTGNSADITYCTPVYGQIVSTRENHNEIDEIQHKFATDVPSSSVRAELRPAAGTGTGTGTTHGWDEFSKRNITSITSEEVSKQRCYKTEKGNLNNGKAHYDFFPYFDNKSPDDSCSADVIIQPMQKLVMHSTDNKCDNALSSIET